jgi:hypothetical protein
MRGKQAKRRQQQVGVAERLGTLRMVRATHLLRLAARREGAALRRSCSVDSLSSRAETGRTTSALPHPQHGAPRTVREVMRTNRFVDGVVRCHHARRWGSQAEQRSAVRASGEASNITGK